MGLKELHHTLSDLLRQGRGVSFKWKCGGEESFVCMYIDGERATLRPDLAGELEGYLFRQLNLPDTGAFCLQGEGKLFFKNEEMHIHYQSSLLGYEDAAGWVETDEIADDFSGTRTIFLNEN